MDENERKQEDRKIRFLRYLVDFSILSIEQEDLTLDMALKLVEDVKQTAMNLFPDKEKVFELVYRPRFKRIIEEKFGIKLENSSF